MFVNEKNITELDFVVVYQFVNTNINYYSSSIFRPLFVIWVNVELQFPKSHRQKQNRRELFYF
jgi:hypothetical protein